MPIQHQWEIEDHVVRVTWQGDVSEADVLALDEALIAYMDSSSKPLVHILSDNTTIGAEPSPAFYNKRQWFQHPQLGWWLSVRQEDASPLNINLVGQITKIRYRVFASEEEAWAFLQEVDATLPDG